MKINSMFHVLVILIAVLTFSIPFVTLAQQYTLQAEAIAAAQRDATANTDSTFWFIVGCFGNVLGLIYANYATPSPPASRLIGKSPEYVAAYSDAYGMKAKQLQTSLAVRGCITNAILTAACSGCAIVIGVLE